MSKYFTDEYKNYIDKIENDKNIETKCNLLNDKVAALDSSLNNYINMMDNSSWYESGKQVLLNSWIPLLKSHTSFIKSGVSNNLTKVVSLVKHDLYDLLIEIREKDKDYCDIQDKINSGDLDSDDLKYNKNKLTTLEEVLKTIDSNIQGKIKEIKGYNVFDESMYNGSNASNLDLKSAANGLLQLYNNTHDEKGILGKLKKQVEVNKIKKLFGADVFSQDDSGYVTAAYSGKSALDNGNCIDLSLLDANWKVVNTKLSVAEYATLAYNKGIRQNSNTERYSDLCLAFSYVHASNMYNGSTSDNAESAYNWQHAGEFTDYFSDNKQETLSVVYDQISEGKPVILQVNGNKQGTSRHFVTVVGVKSDVKNRDEVKESDLLILDSWDGKLERMDTNTSRFMTTGAQCHKSYSGYYLRVLK